jgi:hypothetical protein
MIETTEEKSSTSKSDFLHDYLQKTDLSTTASLNQFAKDHHIFREENETDETFTKRVKKINYLNLAQKLIRNSSQISTTRQIIKPDHVKELDSLPKPAAPLKRMKPVFSPAEDPDFDDEFELDENNSRDIYDKSSSSSSSDDEEIHLRRNPITSIKTNHTFANDIKQKLSNLAADVVRTFGASNMAGIDDDLTKPLPASSSFSSRLFSNRVKDDSIQPASSQINHDSDIDHENDDADLLYTNESLLPQVDWDNLEKQLKQAQIERERYDKVSTVFIISSSCLLKIKRKGKKTISLLILFHLRRTN